jgi:hypothetical protein
LCDSLARRGAEDLDRAFVWPEEPEQERNRGGLACPVRSEQGDRLSSPDFDVEVVEREVAAVAAYDPFESKSGIPAQGISTRQAVPAQRTRRFVSA